MTAEAGSSSSGARGIPAIESSAAAGPSLSLGGPPAVTTRNHQSQRNRTLDDVMRAPSTTLPAVIVLDGLPEVTRKEVLDPKEDLWLSTADG